QIYPASGASGQVFAGFNSNQPLNPDGVITISRINDADPELPFSVGGTLSFTAATINQGGIVRAPFGTITLGTANDGHGAFTSTVNLLPGSITSVSGDGLTIPYGGTSDGVTYTFDGATYGTSQFGNLGISAGTVNLQGRSVAVGAGAVIDASGGGD